MIFRPVRATGYDVRIVRFIIDHRQPEQLLVLPSLVTHPSLRKTHNPGGQHFDDKIQL